jgi:hypothetical protein
MLLIIASAAKRLAWPETLVRHASIKRPERFFRRRAAEEGWPGFHTGTLTIELRIRVGRRDTRGAIGIAHNARLPDLAQVRWLHILENSEPH